MGNCNDCSGGCDCGEGGDGTIGVSFYQRSTFNSDHAPTGRFQIGDRVYVECGTEPGGRIIGKVEELRFAEVGIKAEGLGLHLFFPHWLCWKDGEGPWEEPEKEEDVEPLSETEEEK